MFTKEDDEENPCAGRWSNMSSELTARMWGIFDETGIFLALCRHGFVLVVADMIQSGELSVTSFFFLLLTNYGLSSKYPLAVVEVLLDVFGPDIGGGYDIGCQFRTTLDRSELGPRSRELKFKMLVGAFHGHAHNRICQLSFLATYVKGMGLEDLEGCERFFSKSNALASSLRYASVFHRQQKMVEFMKHIDTFETYPNLSQCY
jgi:Kyakuja-Dileera-Zisupton transposase